MDDSFKISDLKKDVTGDYLSFDVIDGDRTIPARLSGAAVRILAGTDSYDSEEVFKANNYKIREAAFRSMRANPDASIVLLGEGDFSSGV